MEADNLITSRPTVRELIASSGERLRAAGIDSPVLDAEVLISRATGRSRTELYTHPEYQPSQPEMEIFSSWLDRRIRREPLPYIIGEREFYDLTFEVAPGVLIPRPETELLVETAIKFLKDKCSPTVADIGVGSGALAVSIAKHLPAADVYGTDNSPDALSIATRNAERAEVALRVRYLEGDLLQPLAGKTFDMIVSNPPYIPSDVVDLLQPEVSLYEPHGALDGGIDGLDCVRRIVADAPGYLKPGGALAIEIGAGQSERVQELFLRAGFTEVHAVMDYSKIERIVMGIHE